VTCSHRPTRRRPRCAWCPGRAPGPTGPPRGSARGSRQCGGVTAARCPRSSDCGITARPVQQPCAAWPMQMLSRSCDSTGDCPCTAMAMESAFYAARIDARLSRG
jgi:hypothetical protein